MSSLHRIKRGKNLALLGILVGLVVVFYFLTILKVSGA